MAIVVEPLIEEVKVDPLEKYFKSFDYVDFGENVEEVEGFYEIKNENIEIFDEIQGDEDDIMCLSDDSIEYSFSEDEEAEEYASFLNFPSTEYAISRVGLNDCLNSWLEKNIVDKDDKTIAEYERITVEIDKVQRNLRSGLELLFRCFIQGDYRVTISDRLVDFCKRLYLQYVYVTVDAALMIKSLRGTEHLSQDDVLDALRHLGRSVYYEKK